MKEFEMERAQISRIELKKPGLLGTDHIIIASKEENQRRLLSAIE